MNKKVIITIISAILLYFLLSFNKQLALVLILLAFIYLIYKNIPTLYLIRANKKYYDKKIPEALALYEKAYKFKHTTTTAKITYAYILLKQGDLKRSEEILNEEMKKPLSEKDYNNAVINLSIVLWKSDRLNEAVNLLQELHDKDYKNTLLYQSLGYYYVLTGNLQKALDFNLEAYDYNDTDPSILDNLALNYYLMENYDKAIELYDKLMTMNPYFPTAYYYYGLALEQKENYEYALEMFNKALNCNFSFLTAIKKEDVEEEIAKIETILSNA